MIGVPDQRQHRRSLVCDVGVAISVMLLVSLLIPLPAAAQYPVTDRATVDVIRPSPSPRPHPVTPTEVQRAVTTAATATTSAAAVVATGSAIVSLASAAATVAAAAPAGGLPGLLQSILTFFAFRRRRPPWGRVVEEGTNLPVPGAVVTILDAQGKPRQTIQSRADGTFGTLLPSGQYQLAIQREGYAVASSPRGIALFPGERLYSSGLFTVEEDMVTSFVIGLRPLQGGRRLTFRARLQHILSILRVLQAHLALPLFFIGASINTIALLRHPSSPLFIALEVLYGVLFAVEILLSRVVRRAFGRVRDALRKHPVALAIVRLVDAKTQRLVATQATSQAGRFLLLPPPGEYTLQVAHPSYELHVREHLPLRGRGRVRLNVDLTPRRGSSSPAEPVGGQQRSQGGPARNGFPPKRDAGGGGTRRETRSP